MSETNNADTSADTIEAHVASLAARVEAHVASLATRVEALEPRVSDLVNEATTRLAAMEQKLAALAASPAAKVAEGFLPSQLVGVVNDTLVALNAHFGADKIAGLPQAVPTPKTV
jgi:hypothetical protein